MQIYIQKIYEKILNHFASPSFGHEGLSKGGRYIVRSVLNALSGFSLAFFLFGCLKANKSPFDVRGPDGLIRALIAGIRLPAPQVQVPVPPVIKYSGSFYSFAQGIAISRMVPSLTGTGVSCTVSPDLPTGLTLDSSTCIISGSPWEVSSLANYTVTVSNSSGSTSFGLTISVYNGCTGSSLTVPWGTFTDCLNGTVQFIGKSGTFGAHTYSPQLLYFAKCSYGQTWNSGTNNCTGGINVMFCSTSDNSCNGNDPNLAVSSGPLFDACNSYSMAGKSWRVPSVYELKFLDKCNDDTMPNNGTMCSSWSNTVINALFPGTGTLYWTSTTNTSNTGTAIFIYFADSNVGSMWKNTAYSVRCISAP